MNEQIQVWERSRIRHDIDTVRIMEREMLVIARRGDILVVEHDSSAESIEVDRVYDPVKVKRG